MLSNVAADYRLWARHPEEMERTNVEGSRNILQAAVDANLERVVFTSSVAAVGRPHSNGQAGIGHEELDPAADQLIGPYKRSKLASDLLAREFARQGLPLVIVNPAPPIGSYDLKPTPTGKMIVAFLNPRMAAFIDNGMNVVHVEGVRC